MAGSQTPVIQGIMTGLPSWQHVLGVGVNSQNKSGIIRLANVLLERLNKFFTVRKHMDM